MILGIVMSGGHLQANPRGGAVIHGSATTDQNGNILTINQGTDRLIMGWQSFSIGAGETTRFVQPSSSSMALNRVYGGTRSMIEGRLEANGGVILVNPAGITVTKSGVVNVNTFIGSTHDITDDEFLKGGSLNFKGSSDASVENYGTIHAETGDIALIARTVRNEGTLSAPQGVVGLAAGDEVLYQPNADERLLVKSPSASAASIHHSGSILAAAAEIKAAGNPYAVAINLDGVIEARGHAAAGIKPRVIVHADQGDIKFGSTAAISASDQVGGGLVSIRAATGNLQVDGKVSGASSVGKGGEIRILGNNITLSGTALLDASGATGGGRIFVGGDYQGGNNPDKHYASEPLHNASTLWIDKGAVINADATLQGDGGVVINWADGTMVSSGSVSVRGGPLGGNGGFVEISGKENLGFDGAVDVGVITGTPGTVLFDPAQIQITSLTDLSQFSEGKITFAGSGFSLTGSNQVSYGSDTNVWVMSQSFFTNFTSGTVILQAYNISLEDPRGNNRANIVLNPDVNLVLESKTGDRAAKIFLPSGIETDGSSTWGDTTRSSIAASGAGYIKLDASQGSQLIIHGDITTAAGDIILISQNGIDLKGGSLKSINGGAVNATSTAANISLNGSQIGSSSGAIQLTASNGSVSALYSSITNSSGPVSIIGQTGFNLTGSSIQSSGGDIWAASPGGAITMYSYAPSGVEANRIGSSIQSGSGSITLASLNEIYLGGSTITTTASSGGAVSLTSSGSFIKLYSDSIGTASVITSTIKAVAGNITLKGAQDGNNNAVVTAADYKFAVTLDGATLSSDAGNIDISTTTGNLWLYYGSLSSTTKIQAGNGNINVTGPSLAYFYGTQIQTTSGNITINSYYNQLYSSQIQSDEGKINVFSGVYTYLADPASFIKSSALGDAVVISSAMNFYNNAGNNALQAPNGRWIVYLQSPANLYNWAAPLNSANDAIWNTPAGSTLAPEKTGNRYVFASAPLVQVTVADRSKTYGQDLSGITLTPGTDFMIVPVNGSGAYTVATSDLGSFTLKYSFPATSTSGLLSSAPVGSYANLGVTVATGSITPSSVTSGTLTVTPAMLAAGITNVSKVYDGTTSVVLGSNNFTLSGLMNGESVGLINTPTNGTYATSGAGSQILMTANASTNLGLSGSAASNYVLSTGSISGYGSITPATLTASLTGSVSKIYDGTSAAALSSANYLLSGVIKGDSVNLNNPSSGSFDTANAGTGKTVSVGGLALTGAAAGNYVLSANSASGAIGEILALPTPTPTPEPAISQADIAAAPTVQNTLQSLTIRNTTTTSSGGSFGSAGPGGGGSSSATAAAGGESSSGGETASSSSSGESSGSSGETASSESSSESSSGSSAEGGSGESSSSAATASSDSSGGSSTSSGGTASSSSSSSSSGGGSSQGAKSQAAAVARLNNPLQGGMVGGGEFQRLNPFSGAEGMHDDHASAGGGAGGSQPSSSGRAAAISVKSPEMQELSSLNDLNVVLMLF